MHYAVSWHACVLSSHMPLLQEEVVRQVSDQITSHQDGMTQVIRSVNNWLQPDISLTSHFGYLHTATSGQRGCVQVLVWQPTAACSAHALHWLLALHFHYGRGNIWSCWPACSSMHVPHDLKQCHDEHEYLLCWPAVI
jgi:hypothetical protein